MHSTDLAPGETWHKRVPWLESGVVLSAEQAEELKAKAGGIGTCTDVLGPAQAVKRFRRS